MFYPNRFRVFSNAGAAHGGHEGLITRLGDAVFFELWRTTDSIRRYIARFTSQTRHVNSHLFKVLAVLVW